MENYVTMPDFDFISQEGMDWINETLPGFDFGEWVDKITSGKNIFKPDGMLEVLFRIFAEEMYASVKILALIVGIVLISAIVENLRNSFGKNDTFNSGLVCLILIIGLATELFTRASDYATGISEDVTNIMRAIVPVVLSLVAGGGYVTTGVITHPILLFMCNVFAEIFDKILIPLAISYLAVSLVDMMSESVELGKFRELIKKLYNFILGFVMTLFTGLLGISSFAGTAMDSVGAKGVKFALSNMVPFVGRSISDAMNAVASASMLLKNAVGIVGIICIVALCVVPVIKVYVIVLFIRISTAICEPVANRKTIHTLTCVGDSLSMINAAVIVTVIMMIISVSIVIGVK